MLAPEEPKRAGDPDFDYLLGLAALDSGKPNEAIFALERVLAVKPNHLQARAEIARAYFATGEKIWRGKNLKPSRARTLPTK